MRRPNTSGMTIFTTFAVRCMQSAMQKLEIYNFANAGHWMFQENGAPYIENIGNDYDNVSTCAIENHGIFLPRVTNNGIRLGIDST